MSKPIFIQSDPAYGNYYINLSQISLFRVYRDVENRVTKASGLSTIYAELSGGERVVLTKVESNKADKYLEDLLADCKLEILPVVK